MASIQGGLLVAQVRRDPRQLRIALIAARAISASPPLTTGGSAVDTRGANRAVEVRARGPLAPTVLAVRQKVRQKIANGRKSPW